MDQNTGKWIVIAGIGVVIVGIIIYLLHDKLHWIGRLPGDIRVEKENFRFYFPITTMILFSVLLTIIINVIRRLF
jgi:H+/Cl- antiporter ClcA